MITTTLNRIRAHGLRNDCWRKLLSHLGKTEADDEPLSYSVIVESNGLDGALRCCRAEPKHNHIWRGFAWWCANEVRHLMKDERSTHCLYVVRRYLDGGASKAELIAARDAANDATRDARNAAEAAQEQKFLELVNAKT